MELKALLERFGTLPCRQASWVDIPAMIGMLKDYIAAVDPETTVPADETIYRYIRDTGPWYVLADEQKAYGMVRVARWYAEPWDTRKYALISYLFVDEKYRSPRAVMSLLRTAIDSARAHGADVVLAQVEREYPICNRFTNAVTWRRLEIQK